MTCISRGCAALLARVSTAGPWLVILVALCGAPTAQGDEAALLADVDRQTDDAWTKARQIWDWAEPGYQETKSAALLSDWLEAQGFRLQRGVGGIPTAFIAEYGAGSPVVAILGEFDALPGLSQEVLPTRQPREGNGYGHGCGHHLFGVASAVSAIAVAERIKAGDLKGTVRYYGCPAEEGGSAKAFMVREGLFEGVDSVLHWHPGSTNSAGNRSSLARIAVRFRFHGTSAHAGGAPEQGRSSLDAVELMNHAVELLREHTPEESRIHYVITDGGQAPNIVPDYSEVYYYVRHPRAKVVQQLYNRVVKCAEAGALATETRLEIAYEGGIVEILPNTPLSEVIVKRLRQLNDLSYTPEEAEFASRLSETLVERESFEKIREVSDRSGVIGRGSTDVGDVSWAVPTGGFSTACWVPGTPGHSWQAVACGGTTIAKKGMMLAARVLAASAYDLLSQPELIASAKSDRVHRLERQEYTPLILPEQKPPLDYRTPRKKGVVTE